MSNVFFANGGAEANEGMIKLARKYSYANREIAERLIENHLLVLTAGPGMRLMPPLTIPREEIRQALMIMKEVLA